MLRAERWLVGLTRCTHVSCAWLTTARGAALARASSRAGELNGEDVTPAERWELAESLCPTYYLDDLAAELFHWAVPQNVYPPELWRYMDRALDTFIELSRLCPTEDVATLCRLAGTRARGAS